MTENKRFTVTQDFEEHHRQIRDNGHIIMGCFVEPQAEVIVDKLNELHDENKQLKAKVDDKEVAVEVECEKLMQKVLDLIDDKIKYYRKQPHLAVRISTNCEHRKSCLHNQEVNVCNKAKENAYRELKKELQE